LPPLLSLPTLRLTAQSNVMFPFLLVLLVPFFAPFFLGYNRHLVSSSLFSPRTSVSRLPPFCYNPVFIRSLSCFLPPPLLPLVFFELFSPPDTPSWPETGPLFSRCRVCSRKPPPVVSLRFIRSFPNNGDVLRPCWFPVEALPDRTGFKLAGFQPCFLPCRSRDLLVVVEPPVRIFAFTPSD